LSRPEPESEARKPTVIVVDVLYAGELPLELGATVSSSVVVSAPGGSASRLPALSTATVKKAYVPSPEPAE